MQCPLESFENISPPMKRNRTTGTDESTGGATNVTYQQHKVERDERVKALGKYPGYRGCTIWFTGLSGAGKTTIAFGVEKVLNQVGIPAYGLDGDNVRHGLCKNLGFSKEERSENIRRVAEVAKLFTDMGVVTLAAFISPFHEDRDSARATHLQGGLQFFEVYVNTPLDICEKRDPKSLYKMARAGELREFTGIDSAYDEPIDPDLVVEAGKVSEMECVRTVLEFLRKKDILPYSVNGMLFGTHVRELFIDSSSRELFEKRMHYMPKISINEIDVQWLQVLSEGWATPLSGFMRERQYLQCLYHGLLFDLKHKCDVPDVIRTRHRDKNWLISEPVNQSIPIVLPIDDNRKGTVCTGGYEVISEIALTFKGKILAVLCDGELYDHRKEERIARQFGTMDKKHPVIKQIMESGDWLLGGDLNVFERIVFNDGLDKYRLTPDELRAKFSEAKCDAVFVFQLRNPIHNGHVLLMQETRKKLLEKYTNPMLLLHPLGGWVKDDDVPLSVRIKQHEAVIEEGILDPSWTVLSIFPSPMLYAGPKEVQWHAKARLVAGATTYIVGRDPAGIQNAETGNYLYDPTHGAKVLTMAPGLQTMEVIPFRVAAYDKVNNKMNFYDESRKDDFLFISGTKMRSFARDGIQPPEGFMSPKAWQVLYDHYKCGADTNNSQNMEEIN